MLDEYRALSVALRRPLGRWWRRVGLWWLLGLTVLMLAEGAIRGYIVPWLEAGSKSASTGSGGLSIVYLLNIAPWGWLGIADVLLCLGRLLVVCGWLLAGTHAMRLSLQLQRDFPHPVPGAIRRLCFLQALAAGWPFMLLWLLIGSSALTYAICAITGRHDTLLSNMALNTEINPVPGMGEPWSALVSIVLILALANTCAEAVTPSWLWAVALGCTPLLKSARDLAFMLPVGHNLFMQMRSSIFADLPKLELGLGWLLGGCFIIILFQLYRHKQRNWASLLLAVLLVSSVLSGFGTEVPLVHHQRITQGLDQIGVSSPLGLTLVFVRGLSDFPRCALVSYQPFEQRSFSWGSWSEDSPDAKAAGALKSTVPVPWFVLVPAWARLIVAPLNLLYILALIYVITTFLLGEPKPRPSPPARANQLHFG